MLNRSFKIMGYLQELCGGRLQSCTTIYGQATIIMVFMVLETKICRSACCEAGLFVEMKRNTRLL